MCYSYNVITVTVWRVPNIYICIKSDTGIPLLTQIKYCLKRDIKLECQLGFSLHFCTF